MADGTTEGTLDENDISITRAAGAMARVRVSDPSGYSVSDDPALPNGGWAGTHLTRSITGATQHLFVYTDKEEPTRIQFYDFDGDPDTPNLYGATVNGSLTPAPTDGTPADTATAIAGLPITATNASPVTLDLTRFPAPGPAPEGDVTQNYAVNDDPGNTDDNTHVSIPGNFNGAGGRYTCEATDAAVGCSVTVQGDSKKRRFIPRCAMQDSCWGRYVVLPSRSAGGVGGGPLGVTGALAGLRLPLPLARKRPLTRPPPQAGYRMHTSRLRVCFEGYEYAV